MKPIHTAHGYWNGEFTATFTACIVRLLESPEHPLWWHNAFAGQERQAIEITYGGQTWIIDNGTGTGYYKVTKGMGSPTCGHSSISKYELIRYIDRIEWITEIKHDVITVEREIIEIYQKQKDPVEFERLKSLEASMERFQKMTPAEKLKHINENMMGGGRPKVMTASPSRKLNHKGKRDGNGKR